MSWFMFNCRGRLRVSARHRRALGFPAPPNLAVNHDRIDVGIGVQKIPLRLQKLDDSRELLSPAGFFIRERFHAEHFRPPPIKI